MMSENEKKILRRLRTALYNDQCNRTPHNGWRRCGVTEQEAAQSLVEQGYLEVKGDLYRARKLKGRLTAVEIKDIRARYERGESQVDIAMIYEITQAYVSYIVSEKRPRWRI